MHSACLDRGRGEVERVTTTSFPSDPETGARSAAARAQACPAPSSLLVLQDARRGARPRPQDVVAACPTSSPQRVHEPAMTEPTAAPIVGTRSPYELLSVTPTLCLRAGLPSLAHRALRVHGACLDRGRGKVKPVTTMAFCCSSTSMPGARPRTCHDLAQGRANREAPRSALRAALHPANSVASRVPSIDHALCVRRAHGDAGAGRNLSPATRGPRAS